MVQVMTIMITTLWKTLIRISKTAYPSIYFAFTLQLVIRDGLKEAGRHLKTVIARTASIVGSIRKSIHATEILENSKSVCRPRT